MSERLAIQGGPPVRTKPFGPGHDFGDDDIAALTEVIRSGHVGKGPKVDQFERAFGARHGVKHAIAVTSGTAAMHVCIGAINPDPGDEIIVTPWTAGGTIIGALLHNCVPVFADIDESYTLDPADVEAKITPRTRAIIAVHYLGNPCNMRALRAIARRHDLALIEDCAQAHFAEQHGQVVGSIGDIAGFSFGGKHLSGGTGGAVLTNDTALWERAVLFHDVALPRANGPYADRPYGHHFLAPHYIINDLTAAVLLVQLEKVDGYIASKIRAAEQIIDRLADIDELTPQAVRPGDRHTYWILGFTLDTERLGCSADEFADAVRREGVLLIKAENSVDARHPSIGLPRMGGGGPLYNDPFLAGPDCYGRSRFPLDHGRDHAVDYGPGACPNGEALMGRTVGFNMWPYLTDADIDDIVRAFRKVALHYRGRAPARA